MELHKKTIKEIRKLIDTKELSPEEVYSYYFNRIKKDNSKLNAFVTVNETPKIDTKLKNKPLYGIPFSMKDIFMTEGIRTTASSNILKDYKASYNATVYQKLIDNGALLIGKTNNDAWGHGSTTENSAFGPSKNPHDPEYIAGGSTGGEAVALASGMSALGIGEDTGGSIRFPSSMCGTIGLKVTYGLVSRFGAISYASSLDTVGPMARNVEDIATVLQIIAGNDPLDATSSNRVVPDYSISDDFDLRGTRIGIPKEYFSEGIDNEVKKTIEYSIDKLRKEGVEFIEVSLPMTKYAIAVYYLIAVSETSSNLARYDGIRFGNDRSNFEEESKRRILLGTYTLSSGYYDAYYLKAAKVRTLIKEEFDTAFKNVDALIAPVSPTPPFKIGEKIDDPVKMYLSDILTVSVNLAGIPALALPSGTTKSGLPIGMQLIGKQFDEKTLINIGYKYEQELRTQNSDLRN